MYLIIGKNEQVLTWLFESLEESISSQKTNERPARNLLITFEIVQKLSSLIVEKPKSEHNHRLFIRILTTFDRFFYYLKLNRLSEDCLFQAVSSLIKVVENLNTVVVSEADLNGILNQLVNQLLEMTMLLGDSGTDMAYLFENETVLARVSLVFKSFSLR